MSRNRPLQSEPSVPEQSNRDFDSPYLLTHEAAVYLRFNTANLFRKWAVRNRIPAKRRGRTLLYDRRVLEASIAVRGRQSEARARRHAQTVAATSAGEKSNSLTGNEVAQ